MVLSVLDVMVIAPVVVQDDKARVLVNVVMDALVVILHVLVDVMVVVVAVVEDAIAVAGNAGILLMG